MSVSKLIWPVQGSKAINCCRFGQLSANKCPFTIVCGKILVKENRGSEGGLFFGPLKEAISQFPSKGFKTKVERIFHASYSVKDNFSCPGFGKKGEENSHVIEMLTQDMRNLPGSSRRDQEELSCLETCHLDVTLHQNNH